MKRKGQADETVVILSVQSPVILSAAKNPALANSGAVRRKGQADETFVILSVQSPVILSAAKNLAVDS